MIKIRKEKNVWRLKKRHYRSEKACVLERIQAHYYIPSYLPCHRLIRLLKHITTCYTPWPHSQHELHVSKPVYISKFVISGALNSLPLHLVLVHDAHTCRSTLKQPPSSKQQIFLPTEAAQIYFLP